MEKYYLKIGRASDLVKLGDRVLFRLFEILPGAVSLSLLFLVVILSWFKPLWVAVFIIVFVIFWVLRTIYFSFHLRTGYKKMAENEKVDWRAKLNMFSFLPYHLIVIPMYKESLEIMRDTFKSLENCDYPKDKMIVVLGCEGKNGDSAQFIAQKIEQEFGPKFFRFLVTWHPADISGELAGKGSNEAWASRKAKELIIDTLAIPYRNIIYSSFDADTCIFFKYFSCLTFHYLTSEKPVRTSFQPIPLFINNIWQAPVISRIFSFSSSFWHTINQERPEKMVTFSSHSMSFQALADVGFQQTNVVSEDSRIFWQCFFEYDGDYRVEPLYYPVSMDANVAKSFWRTMLNIYKQQRRWAYGAENIPYFLFGFIKNKKIPFLKKLSLGFEIIEGQITWAIASIFIFLLGWLPIFVGGPDFAQTLLSYNLPKIVSSIMTFSMLGLIFSAYLSFLIIPPKPPSYGRFKYFIFAFSWLLFPVMMLFFTSFPALDAQIRLMLGKYMGFWATEKVRK